MTIPLNISALLLILMGTSSILISSLVLSQEIGEVNRKLSNGDQISYWGMHAIKMAKIKREYKRLYPQGKLDVIRQVFQYAAFVFFALALIPLGFFSAP